MNYNYLFTIPNSDLCVWDVKRFYKNEVKSKYPVEPLGWHIKNENNKMVLSNYPEKQFDVLGVTNTEGIIDAYSAQGKSFNQPYKIVNRDYIAYNPYRVNVGSIGIKKGQKGNLISPAYVVFSCKNTILPDYLFLLMKSSKFNEMVCQNTSGSVRQNLTFKALSRIKIPVPNLEEQQRLLSEFQIKNIEANKLACNYYLIDDYIKNNLSIEDAPTKCKSDIQLNVIDFCNLANWDVKNRSSKNILATKEFRMVSLNQIAQINPSMQINLPDEAEISFIPMECVADFSGEVLEYRTIAKGTKGYTKFQNGDIIWAKITPCMQNGKSAIVENMKNGVGYGSTEFHVIRVNNKVALTEYIYYLLRMYMVREEAKQYFTGSAGQQRVSANYLKNLMVPLPSLEEQEKLVIKLDKLKSEIKINREKQLSLINSTKQEFEESIFG